MVTFVRFGLLSLAGILLFSDHPWYAMAAGFAFWELGKWQTIDSEDALMAMLFILAAAGSIFAFVKGIADQF